jgi:hypothetical protein
MISIHPSCFRTDSPKFNDCRHYNYVITIHNYNEIGNVANQYALYKSYFQLGSNENLIKNIIENNNQIKKIIFPLFIEKLTTIIHFFETLELPEEYNDYIKKNSVCLDEFYFHIVFKEIIGNLHNNCLFMKKIVIPKLPLIKRDETKIKLFFIDLFQYLYQGKIFLTPIVEISFLDKNDDLSCYNDYILKRVL